MPQWQWSSQLINQTISHYKIIKKLGQGGMGEVFLAEDTELRRKVALKFLPPHFTSNAALKARFKREAQAAAALNHPNIVTVHEIGEHNGVSYIVMEYVEGASLKDLNEQRELSLDKALDFVIQICSGLGKAHQAGVWHRDIKPANILINRDGRVKIVDFGLAKLQDETQLLTQTGTTMGTPHYMSPEQAKGERVDQRSDIFSTGVVLYELLTGQRPFKGESQPAILYAISYATPAPLANHNSNLPASLQRMVDKALAKDPRQRYQQIDGLLADLRKEINIFSEPATATKTIPAFEERKTRQSKKPRIAFAAVAALLLAALVIYFLVAPDSKKISSPFDRASLSFSTTPKQAEVFLTIHVNPVDAKVILDGKSEISDLTSLVLPVGNHALTISRENYKTKQAALQLLPGDTTLFFTLEPESAEALPLVVEPAMGAAKIVSTPAEAAIFLDGRPQGKTPNIIRGLPAGNYSLTLKRAGFKDYSQTITVRGNQTMTVAANLAALMSGVMITSEPSGAAIFLNGNWEGVTPKIIQKPAGNYQAVLRKSDYSDYSIPLTIEHEQAQTVHAKLAALAGQLKVLVMPFGSVYIDGKLYQENTDRQFTAELSAGTHILRAVHHFGIWEKPLTIAPGATLEVIVDFNKIVKLTVTSAPVLGEIVVDGVSKGYAPKQFNLRVGQHTLEIRRDGYLGETKVINLEADADEPLNFTLKKIQ